MGEVGQAGQCLVAKAFLQHHLAVDPAPTVGLSPVTSPATHVADGCHDEGHRPSMPGMTRSDADDPLWQGFVDAVLTLAPADERPSRYGAKPALVLDGREIAHREGPGLIDLRLTRAGWAGVLGRFAHDPRVRHDAGRRDWIELQVSSVHDLDDLTPLIAAAVAANQ